MALLRPFRALMPTPAHARAVAAPPYDVLTSAEARVRAAGERLSFLHVSKPEIDLPEATAPDAAEVYATGARNMAALLADGVIARTEAAHCYVYRVRIGEHCQTGIAGAVSVADYRAGLIRRHELTRPDKVADRARQIEAVDAHTGPVMLAYRDDPALARVIAAITAGAPTLEATIDGADHFVWVPSSSAAADLGAALDGLARLYIADGHHRSEAASSLAERLGIEDATFLGIAFPESEMRILDYNRVVRDLGGRTAEALLAELSGLFDVARADTPVRPDRPHIFGMYLDKTWYRLVLRTPPAADSDPVERLDVAVLARTILGPLLGIGDPTLDKRIDFVGGSRGLEGLRARVDSGEMAVAFALYPTRPADLFAVADAGAIMPPKSTWFDPKLADGLLSLPLDRAA